MVINYIMLIEQNIGIQMKDLRGYMTEEEVKRLIEGARNERDKLLLRFLWITGARISEVVGDHSWYKDQVFEGFKVKDLWNESAVILDTLKRKQYPPPKRRVQIDKHTMQLLREMLSRKT